MIDELKLAEAKTAWSAPQSKSPQRRRERRSAPFCHWIKRSSS